MSNLFTYLLTVYRDCISREVCAKITETRLLLLAMTNFSSNINGLKDDHVLCFYSHVPTSVFTSPLIRVHSIVLRMSVSLSVHWDEVIKA